MMVMTCRDVLNSTACTGSVPVAALLQSALVLARKLLAHEPRGRQGGWTYQYFLIIHDLKTV